MSAAEPFVAVMIPAHNEEVNIAATLRELTATLAAAAIADYLLVVVDDGSTDGTQNAVRTAAAADGRITLLRHECNRGMGAAIRTAWSEARRNNSRHVYLHPGDNQFAPSLLPRMLERIGDGDIVIGIREAYNPGGWRKFLSRLQETATAVLLGNRYRDMCGVNLYRTELLERLDPQLDSCWMNIELIIKAQRLGLRLAACPVEVRPRAGGSSSVGSWRSQIFMAAEFFRLLQLIYSDARWRGRVGAA